jgi:PKD repeat protein
MFAVNMPGVFLPNDAGAPNLPGQGQFIAVPNGATAKLNIINQRTETFQNVEIAPAPQIPLDGDDSPLVYEKNMTIYGQDAFYPASPVIISELKNIRGVSAVMVGITPFQYNPLTKELVVVRDIEFEIVFEGGNGEFGDPRLRSRWWDPILSSSILNSQALPEMDYTYVNPGVTENDEFEYIIITLDDPDFLDWANTIKEYREKQGITTGVVTTDDLGGNSVANIESYIDNAYYNWSTAPSAVLLLGDYGYGATGIISHMFAHPASYPAFASDNKYADVNNDELPDVVLARITANNAEQLEVMISKFMDYETNPPTDPDFYNHPITALGWQTERWFQICSEAVGGYFKNVKGKDPVRINAIYSGTPGSVWSTATNTSTVVNYFGPNGQGYIPAAPSSMGGWSGGTGTDVVNAINAGSFLLQHRDHGSYTGWGEPAFNSYSINNLQNVDNKLTFVFSINCQTGAFHNSSECFTEKFHRHTHNGENAGALGLLAATEVSYSFVNDTYLWGVIDNMFPDFMPDETTEFPVNYVMPAFGNAAGKHFLFESSWPYNTNNKQVTYRLFHHHGGAFLTLFTEVPSTITVVHDGMIPYGSSTFSLTTTPGALVCLYKDGEILSTATGGFGQSIIPIPGNLQIGDEVTLTITKQNYVRYEEVLEVGELLSANFAADKDSTCAEGLVNFNDLTSGDPTEWLWTFEGGTPETSTEQHPQGIQYSAPGAYDVSLEVTSANSSDVYTMEDYITVIENAEVNVEVSATAMEICDGEEVTFVAEIDNGGETPIIQWKLNGDDVGDGTDTYVSAEFVNGDIVSCEVTSSIECTVQNPVMAEEVVMAVNDILPVGVSIEANSEIICEGDEVIFTATPENGGDAPVYQWYVNGNPVGENSAEFAVSTLAQDDVVSCELTSNADCISGNPAMSNAMNIDLHAYPEALDIPDGPNDIDVYETASSSYTTSEEPGAIAYTWDVTPEEAYSGLTPDMNNLTVSWAEDYTGQVSISVFASNECGDGPVSDNFDVSVMNTFSINENELDVAVSVYPNPNNGSFTIKLSSSANENVKMQIRSILGEVVFTDEELNVNGELVKEIDLSNYAEGIYFLVLENNNKVLTEKIVVQQ